jgi:hypothetical protein
MQMVLYREISMQWFKRGFLFLCLPLRKMDVKRLGVGLGHWHIGWCHWYHSAPETYQETSFGQEEDQEAEPEQGQASK